MKSKIGVLSIALLILNSSVVWGQEKVTVKVFPDIKRQIIQSIGGDYCMARYSNNAWDAIGGQTLKEFRPGCVRVALPMQFKKEPYGNFKGDLITKQPLVITLFETMRRMKNEFGVKQFIVSVWDVPDELVQDPARSAQREIKPQAYDEMLDMLVAFLVKAKRDYGVEADYFSFNESDGGYQVRFSPQATIAFIKKAMERFKAAGLKTKFLLADTAQTKGTVEFATMIMADSTIWKDLGPLCFHSWWSERVPDVEFERIAAFAKAWNKPVWCDELGFDAMAYKVKGMFQSWDYALRLARVANRTLKYAQAEATMYWTWQNDYSIMSTDLKTMYPSYYVTRHLTDFMNTGTQIVHSVSSDPEVLVISGIHDTGTQVMQLINMKKIPVTVDIQGYGSQIIDMVTTTEVNNWQVQKNVTKSKKGHVLIQLKAESVNTLILN
ncbi:MAG: glycosyl hydrolase [Bacteroidota bacterium]|nr:glycosyl hydrolase [Bacteroidota bacterium]